MDQMAQACERGPIGGSRRRQVRVPCQRRMADRGALAIVSCEQAQRQLASRAGRPLTQRAKLGIAMLNRRQRRERITRKSRSREHQPERRGEELDPGHGTAPTSQDAKNGSSQMVKGQLAGVMRLTKNGGAAHCRWI